MSKPSLPQGTRDFGPEVVRKRQYILNTIRGIFELYGFQPLETPAMENLDTLMGKYGEEGDKLIFKILNNGLDNPAKETQVRADLEQVLKGRNNKGITERALKYDLTIPFARYVAMNHGQLTFPFKRYQVQPVWRADRPQKGRYREFYQCDADIVGSRALLHEVELVQIYAQVFRKLGIDVEIRINNRKILSGIAEIIGEPERIVDMTVAIDKVDKIGVDGVREELERKGFAPRKIGRLNDLLFVPPGAGNSELLQFIRNGSAGSSSASLEEGVQELEYIINYCDSLGIDNLQIDLSLARGLNYYTGCIFEVKARNVAMGSIGGGGRYDDLTGLFGVPNIPGVGISFGVDRIYDVLEELQAFPKAVQQGSQVLFFNLGTAESRMAHSLLQALREKGVAGELYHEVAKMDKQFKYAEKKNIPFAVIVGSKELEGRSCTVKDLRNGEQKSVSFDKLTDFLFI
jgi:histidyl-tRNA synthetase